MNLRHMLMGLLVAVSLTAHAEQAEIVVTALRSDGYDEMPAVTLTKAADFLVQEVRLINDSRSPDLRKKEIIATIDGMLKRAAKEKNIALSYGEGFLAPLDLTNESLDDVGLSIVNPEKYRYEILARIAEENGRLSKAMGQKCQVKISGLEGRVQWDRTDVAELTLYIPYGVEIAQCSYEPG